MNRLALIIGHIASKLLIESGIIGAGTGIGALVGLIAAGFTGAITGLNNTLGVIALGMAGLAAGAILGGYINKDGTLFSPAASSNTQPHSSSESKGKSLSMETPFNANSLAAASEKFFRESSQFTGNRPINEIPAVKNTGAVRRIV